MKEKGGNEGKGGKNEGKGKSEGDEGGKVKGIDGNWGEKVKKNGGK